MKGKRPHRTINTEIDLNKLILMYVVREDTTLLDILNIITTRTHYNHTAYINITIKVIFEVAAADNINKNYSQHTFIIISSSVYQHSQTTNSRSLIS